jgi:hypothetical protein
MTTLCAVAIGRAAFEVEPAVPVAPEEVMELVAAEAAVVVAAAFVAGLDPEANAAEADETMLE